ncbi:CLUMA_CG014576, isoform A [Clunio marinus]|uniref:CLUMA_CG014576, isoform A n=1 Tax=Clunio marinus TaxID=568069 RepID=A0A1J1IN16_9DIPT|nr:CLUMA_CG014576, isoform A [Clunio marinus]
MFLENSKTWLLLSILNFGYFILLMFASVELLKAIKDKEVSPMNFYLITLIIGIAITILHIFLGNWKVILILTLIVVYKFYNFLVIFSLKQEMKEEI